MKAPRPARGAGTYLDFERPLQALDRELARLVDAAPSARREEAVRRLRAERRRVQQDVLGSLTPWQRVQLSRHPDRPTMLDYLDVLFRDFVELHGDRRFADDHAIVAGMADYKGLSLIHI